MREHILSPGKVDQRYLRIKKIYKQKKGGRGEEERQRRRGKKGENKRERIKSTHTHTQKKKKKKKRRRDYSDRKIDDLHTALQLPVHFSALVREGKTYLVTGF